MKDSQAADFGERVRTERTNQGLSIATLAGIAGIGKGSLSEIENGMRSPTLSTLQSLAWALRTPASTLIDVKHGSEFTSVGVRARWLGTQNLSAATVETYHLHLDPGANFESRSLYLGAIQHILMTGGRAIVGPKWRPHNVATGDTATWPVRGFYVYRAVGDDPVDAVLVIRWHI